MSTDAQIAANRENAQHSTGPKTETGKAASCMNNFRFGFTGVFEVLESEDQDEFDYLFHGLSVEHQVKTMTERILVIKMAQHHWLSLRAQRPPGRRHERPHAHHARTGAPIVSVPSLPNDQ